jgi:hypothetical protein
LVEDGERAGDGAEAGEVLASGTHGKAEGDRREFVMAGAVPGDSVAVAGAQRHVDEQPERPVV